uniref:Uncharacterized protein n=1 Tax=Capra hircus TaxID=9925 RepID=A0A8C2RUL5_CAPHI
MSGCGILESESYLPLNSEAFLSVLPALPLTTMKFLVFLALVAVSTFLVSGQDTTTAPQDTPASEAAATSSTDPSESTDAPSESTDAPTTTSAGSTSTAASSTSAASTTTRFCLFPRFNIFC